MQRVKDSVGPSSPLGAAHAKHLCVRRILMAFRSHSRGALARYVPKIEHARMLKNSLGARVLAALVAAGVLRRAGKFYLVDADRLSATLGVSWQTLRDHGSSPKLTAFLASIA